MRQFLDFEKPIAVLEGKIEELRHMSSDMDINIAEEVGRLQKKLSREIKTAYSNLGPWEKVQVARHPDRPKTIDISPVCLKISRRWPVIVILPKIMRLSAALPVSAAMLLLLWVPKRAAPPMTGSNAISAWPALKDTARHGG